MSLSVKSSINKYIMMVTAVGMESFEITFHIIGDTSTDATMINFNVIKGSIN